MKSKIETPIIKLNALGVTHEEAQQIAYRLKTKRVQNNLLSLDHIAEELKIKVSFLQIIESGEWDSLPYCSIGRGLIRVYAKKLGISIPEFDKFLQGVEADSLLPMQTNMDSIVSLMRKKSLENSVLKKYIYRVKENLENLGILKKQTSMTASAPEIPEKTSGHVKKTWILVSSFGFFAIGLGIGISIYLLSQREPMDTPISEQSMAENEESSAQVTTFSPIPIQNTSISLFSENANKSDSSSVKNVK